MKKRFITLRDNGVRYGPFPTKQWKFMRKAQYINEQQRTEFSVGNFREMTPENFRQYILKLHNYLENEVPGSYPKFYKIKGVEFHYANRQKVSGKTLGDNVVSILDRLPESAYTIKDLQIQYESGNKLFNILANFGDLNFSKPILWEWYIYGININVRIDSKNVHVKLECEKTPIVYDMYGILKITEILGMISGKIYNDSHNILKIPSIGDWLCISYRLGNLGQYLYNSPEFYRTWKDLAGGFMRKYAIQTKNNQFNSYN